jgi:hypothetical protein
MITSDQNVLINDRFWKLPPPFGSSPYPPYRPKASFGFFLPYTLRVLHVHIVSLLTCPTFYLFTPSHYSEDLDLPNIQL